MEERQPRLSRLDRWVRRRPWVADGLLAALLAALLAPPSLALVWGAPWPLPARAALLGGLVLGHLAVAVRRTHPVVAYAVCCVVMAALVAAPDITGSSAVELAGAEVPPIVLPSALVYPVALYSLAAWASRPWQLPGLALGAVGAVLTTLRLTLSTDWLAGQPAPGGAAWPLFALAALLAVVLASWALGRFRSVRAAYVAALEERERRAEQYRAERAEQAVQAERARIAREVHDVVAHSLSVMVRQAEGGRFAAAGDPRVAVQALRTIADTGREALADMRSVLGVLRQGTTGAGPQPTVADVGALVDRVRAAGVPVTLETTGEEQPLGRVASLAAYRVVQEALTNSVKHAGPGAAARVRLSWSDSGLDITVGDDGGGAGTTAQPAADDGGSGLVGMRERMALLGGRLTAGPDRDGFVVRAHLPRSHQVPPS